MVGTVYFSYAGKVALAPFVKELIFVNPAK